MRLHISAGHAVTLVDVGKRVVAAEGITVDDALDQAANVQEADLVAQEVRNGGLVRTVGGAGSQTALADSLFAGFEAAEGLVVRRCNAQLGQRGEVELRHGAGQALGLRTLAAIHLERLLADRSII